MNPFIALTLTKDKELKENPIFKKIEKIINRIYNEGLLDRVRHNCISASEIMQKLLATSGIKSRSIECTLSMIRNEDEYFFIGFDDYSFAGEVDTHVVVITETQPQMLIDLSISHLLPPNHPCIIEKVNSIDPEIISEYNIDGIKMVYNIKRNIKLPHIHQKNVIERFEYEMKTADKLKWVTSLVFVAMILAGINFIFNSWAIAMRYDAEEVRQQMLDNQKELYDKIEHLQNELRKANK